MKSVFENIIFSAILIVNFIIITAIISIFVDLSVPAVIAWAVCYSVIAFFMFSLARSAKKRDEIKLTEKHRLKNVITSERSDDSLVS